MRPGNSDKNNPEGFDFTGNMTLLVEDIVKTILLSVIFGWITFLLRYPPQMEAGMVLSQKCGP